jgi:hypothetical protein
MQLRNMQSTRPISTSQTYCIKLMMKLMMRDQPLYYPNIHSKIRKRYRSPLKENQKKKESWNALYHVIQTLRFFFSLSFAYLFG